MVFLAVEIGATSPHAPPAFLVPAMGASSFDQAITPSPAVNIGDVLAIAWTSVSREPAADSSSVIPGGFSNVAKSANSYLYISIDESGGGVLAGPAIARIESSTGGAIAEPPGIELPGTTGDLSTGLVDDTFEVEVGDGSDPPLPFPLPLPDISLEAIPGRGAYQTNINDETPELGYAGPLPLFESNDDLSTWLSTALATDRASGAASGFSFMGRSLQIEPNSELPVARGLSFLATGGWTSLASEPSVTLGDDAPTIDEGSSEPVLPASITAGGVPLRILLGNPDLPGQTEPGGLEQVAELIPMPKSSLALAATLWTVATDSQTSLLRSDQPSDAGASSSLPSASGASWAVFVTGTDQAFQQAFHEVREGILLSTSLPADNERPAGDPDKWLESKRPILPAAEAGLPAVLPRDAQGEGTSPFHENLQARSDQGRPIVSGTMSMLSGISISTLVVGWFRSMRKRRTRLGLGRRVGIAHRSSAGGRCPPY